MKRHPKNNNLKLFFGESYEGFDVLLQHLPMVEEYLSRALYVTRLALLKHPRTFAFRVDLRFPADQVMSEAQTNKPLERFFASLRAKIHQNRKSRIEDESPRVSQWLRGLSTGGFGLLDELQIIPILSLGRWDVADGLKESLMVEPGHPFEGGELQGFDRFPGRPAVNQFSLVQTVDGFG